MNLQSAILARNNADLYTKKNPDKPRFVAGILGPTNKMLSISSDVNNPGERSITFDKLSDAYTVAVSGLVDGNVDIIMIETIFDTLNCKAAIFAIKKYFALKKHQHTDNDLRNDNRSERKNFVRSDDEAFYYSVIHADPLSVGLNCALGIDKLAKYVIVLSDISSRFVSVHPNAGLPNEFGEYDQSPEFVAEKLKNTRARRTHQYRRRLLRHDSSSHQSNFRRIEEY